MGRSYQGIASEKPLTKWWKAHVYHGKCNICLPTKLRVLLSAFFSWNPQVLTALGPGAAGTQLLLYGRHCSCKLHKLLVPDPGSLKFTCDVHKRPAPARWRPPFSAPALSLDPDTPPWLQASRSERLLKPKRAFQTFQSRSLGHFLNPPL